jgi:hypothetical protein
MAKKIQSVDFYNKQWIKETAKNKKKLCAKCGKDPYMGCNPYDIEGECPFPVEITGYQNW